MEKIYYNADGWVCNRYPYGILIDDTNRYIEVDNEMASETYSCAQYMAWRVVNGVLVVEQYEEVPQEVIYKTEYENLKQQLADMDYKTSKYVDGEYTEEEWAIIIAERKEIRIRIRELENLLGIL